SRSGEVINSDPGYHRDLEFQATKAMETLASAGWNNAHVGDRVKSKILPGPRLLQAVTVSPAILKKCLGSCGAVAVPDPDTQNPTGCALADCGRPVVPAPPAFLGPGVTFYCLYGCSRQGAVLFTCNNGMRVGPVYTIV